AHRSLPVCFASYDDRNSCARNHLGNGMVSVRVPSELGLELAGFVPYRLNRLAVGVSNHLSDIYRERFGLDVPEWRVMATVGSWHGCTAQHIERASSAADRREREVRLTKAGRRMYTELVPLVLERERELLACLTKEQLRGFLVGMEVLESFLGLQD